MRKLRNAVLAGTAVLAAGCSNSGAQQPTPTVTVTVTAEPSTAADAQPAALEVGRRRTFNDAGSSGTAAVLKFRQPFPARFPPDRAGYEFAGVEIRRCFKTITTDQGITVGWEPWSLTYKDGTVVEPPSSWSAEHFSVPLYPRDRPVRAGQCVRGWIPYEVPKGRRPSSVAYTVTGSDGKPVQVEWAVR